MEKETLELRGISRNDVCNYLKIIGGLQENESLFKGDGWTCTVSPEETFRFLQSDVPKVFVTFDAKEKEQLNSILTDFRKKTFRIGG